MSTSITYCTYLPTHICICICTHLPQPGRPAANPLGQSLSAARRLVVAWYRPQTVSGSYQHQHRPLPLPCSPYPLLTTPLLPLAWRHPHLTFIASLHHHHHLLLHLSLHSSLPHFITSSLATLPSQLLFPFNILPHSSCPPSPASSSQPHPSPATHSRAKTPLAPASVLPTCSAWLLAPSAKSTLPSHHPPLVFPPLPRLPLANSTLTSISSDRSQRLELHRVSHLQQLPRYRPR